MIEQITKSNLNEVLPLIRKYQEFYKVAEISDEKNQQFFSQFAEGSPLGCQFAFRMGGELVAFATVYFTFTSTIAAKVAVLNDLYTLPNARRSGVAKKLVEHCRQYAANNGAARLQWVTAPDNKQAQKLYNTMDTSKSMWHFYTYKT